MSDNESDDSHNGQRLPTVKTILKGAENYTTWDRQIGSTLMGLDLLSTIQVPRPNPLLGLVGKEATDAPPPNEDPLPFTPKPKVPSSKKRQRAWYIIYSSLSNDIISRLSLNAGDWNIADAYLLWNELKTSYGVSTMQEFARRLNIIFSTNIPENKDPMPYLSRINAAFTECAQAGHLALDDRLLAAAMLKALPASYCIICQSEYAKPTLVSTSVAASICVEWDRQVSSGAVIPTNDSASAGLVARPQYPQQPRPDPKSYCPIHKSNSHPLSKCQVALQVFQPAAVTQPPAKANIAMTVEPYIASALRMSPTVYRCDGYYVDLGATEHIASDDYRFLEMQPCMRPISTANDQIHYTTHVGKVQLADGFVLDDVLLVPSLKCNLISVNRLFAAGFKVIFSETDVGIWDNTKLLVKAPFANGLYTITASFHPPISANLAESADPLLYWHRRLGHRSFREVARLGSEGKLGKDWRHVTVKELSNAICVPCIIGKGKRLPHHARSDRENSPNNLVHIDLWGPAPTQSPSGTRYFLTCYDDHTKHLRVYGLKTKDQALARFADYIKLVETQCSTKIKRVRLDNGGEFTSGAFQCLLADHGIIPNFVPPDAHGQNGRVERAHLTIANTVRTLLADTDLPPSFWFKATNYTVHVLNRLPDLVSRHVPYTQWSGHTVDLSHLRPFGTECYIRNHTQKNKLGPRYFKALLVGWQEDSEHVVWYYNPAARVFGYSRNVVFAPPSQGSVGVDSAPQPPLPSKAPSEIPLDDLSERLDVIAAGSQPSPSRSTLPATPSTPTAQQISHPLGPPKAPARPGPQSIPLPSQPPVGPFERVQPAQAATESSQTPPAEFSSLPSSPITPLATKTFLDLQEGGVTSTPMISSLPSSPITPLATQIFQDLRNPPSGTGGETSRNDNHDESPVTYNDSLTLSSDDSNDPIALLAAGLQTAELKQIPVTLLVNSLDHADLNPTSYRQARNSGQWEHWKAAMDDELAKMEQYKVFQIMPRTSDMHVLKARWVYTRKIDGDTGKVDAFKARWVAKGYAQQEGIHFNDIHASVVHKDSIRVLLSLVNYADLECDQVDIKAAFLNGELEETIYMEPPEGSDIPADQVIKLCKSLYGLRQSPRCFNQAFDKWMKSDGFQPTCADPCLYICKTKTSTIYLSVHVDDQLIASDSRTELDAFKRRLNERFPCTDNGPVNYFLGFNVIRDRPNRKLSHRSTMWKHSSNASECPRATPRAPGLHFLPASNRQ